MKPDDIDLQLQHERHGWASARLTISLSEPELDRTQHLFRLTDVGDSPIKALADATLLLAEGQPQVTFTWYDAPGRFDWKFSRIPSAHHLDRLEISCDADYSKERCVSELPWDAIQALCGKISP